MRNLLVGLIIGVVLGTAVILSAWDDYQTPFDSGPYRGMTPFEYQQWRQDQFTQQLFNQFLLEQNSPHRQPC